MFGRQVVRRQEDGLSMISRMRGPRLAVSAVVCGLAALLIAACGASSSAAPGNARTLLRETFSGAHKLTSGRLEVSLRIVPHGSSTLTDPITISFGGPFASLGRGRLPKSDFTVSVSAQRHTAALSVLSTGTRGYITISGESYELPAATFERLESNFSSVAGSGSGSSKGSGELAKLGIDPLHWLIDPKVVGTATVAGAQTTRIRSRIDVSVLLSNIATALTRASSIPASAQAELGTVLSPANRARIAAEVSSPTLTVWTGNRGRTLRRMAIAMSVPVHGRIATLLGGLSSAGIDFTLQYSQLNMPQTITAPTRVAPYREFAARLKSELQGLESGVTSGALGAAAGASASGSGSSAAAGASGATSSYSQCVSQAGTDVQKLQKCASLLG
jgi:hypothetical protein